MSLRDVDHTETLAFLRELEAGVKSVPDNMPTLRGMVHSGWDGQSWFGMSPYSLLFPTRVDHAERVGDMSTNAAVGACLRVLEDNFPQAELRVQAKAKAVGRTRDSESVKVNHPLVKLNDRPNPAYDRYTFWGAMVKSAIVDGNAYAIKIRSRARVPVQLWWVPPWMLTPRWEVGGTEWIGWYEYLVNGRVYAIDPKDVIHWRYGTPDPRNERIAISKLKQAAARVVCSLNEVDAFTATILINGGVPNVAIKPTKEGLPSPTKDQADRMRDDWRSLTQGSRRGEPFIPGGYFDVVPIGFTPEELALDKIPARLEDQVCALTGVNAMIAGLTSGAQHKTYANMAEARRGLYDETLIPMQARLAECLEHQILGDPGMGDPETEEIVFSYDGVACLQEDQDARWTRAGTAYEKGLISRAQGKGLIGLDFDKTDEVYVDVGTIPADPDEARELEAQRQAAAQPSAPGEAPAEDGEDEDATEAEAPAAKSRQAEARVLDLTAQLLERVKSLGGGRNSVEIEGDPANTLGWKAAPKKKPKPKPKPGKPAAGAGGNCGTGQGGFRPGNHCQRPGHGGGSAPKPKPSGSGKPPHQASRFHLPEHGEGIDRKLAINQAAEKAEVEVARIFKGRQVGDFDPLRNKRKPSYDVHIPKKDSPSGREEFLEVKYKSEGKKNELSVHADAKIRKAEHHAETPDAGFHTVLIDVRDRSFGGTEAQHYQGHDLYYRRGAGAYSTANMHRVKDTAELKRLVAMPDHELPEKARGTMPVVDAKLREQAAKVAASRARRDAGGKKAERRRRYEERRRAGVAGTAIALHER